MNYCFVIRALAGGGIETVTLNLAKKLLDRGDDVTIVLLKKGERKYIIDPRIRIVHFEHATKSPIALFARIINNLFFLLGSLLFSASISRAFDNFILNLGKFDRIYFCGLGVYSVLFKSKLDNVIIQCHNANSIIIKKKCRFSYFGKVIYRKMLNCRNINTVSEGIKRDLVDTIGVVDAKINCIYNLLDTAQIKSRADDFDVKGCYIVHVGRFVEEKQQSKIITAYNNIKIENKPKLVFLGDGPLKDKCIRESKENSSIEFIGHVDNPYPYIKNALFLILCSKHEGLPTVLIESHILNTFTLSSDCDFGPSEIISDVNGVTFQEHDLEKYMEKYIRDGMKDNLLSVMNSKFDQQTILEKYI